MLHLLTDDRTAAGAQQSEFVRGACWIGAVSEKEIKSGTHMSLLVGTFTIGFILSLLALGVFISFRIFAFPDITADGSVTLGASIAAALLIHGVTPPVASLAAFGTGVLAGACTGTLHTRFKINPLLSGILVMTALYSVNLHVMGSSNISLLGVEYSSHAIGADRCEADAWGYQLRSSRLEVSVRDATVLGAIVLAVLLTGTLLYWFLRTNLGIAMRATGDNVQMIRALGVNDGKMIVFGIAISNGFVALSGSIVGTIPRLCGRRHGNRNGGVGTCERHHRRSARWNQSAGLDDYWNRDGVRAVQADGSGGVALGSQPQ